MSYAFWPELETVKRVNAQVARCAKGKLVAVWDSRYAAHELAVRKLSALLHQRPEGRVILSFRDPVKYVVSTFNRIPPNLPGGKSFAAVVGGIEVAPAPYMLQLWKGNYSLLFDRVRVAVGDAEVLIQPFDRIVEKIFSRPMPKY